MQSFNEKIENLIGEGASDFEISKLFKGEIRTYLEDIDTYYDKESGKKFMVANTKRIETFIKDIYKYVLRDSFGNYQPSINNLPIAIVALGSFGREQLCIYSDLDIMLVYKEQKGYNLKPMLERILYLAWDAGLKLGHRVHEVDEIFDNANEDITIKTAILESRLIYGSSFLWTEVQNVLTRMRHDAQASFIDEKIEEHQQRLRKYPLSNEPNIKEGFGALRESNTVYWIAKVLYGITYLKDLSGGVIDAEHYREYARAEEFLFQLRIAMHLVSKKKQDTLRFQIQREVALKLGFEDSKTQVAERKLLTKTFASLVSVHTFTKIYIAKFLNKLSSVDRGKKIAEHIYLKESCLYADFEVSKYKFETLLKVLISSKHSSYDGSFIALLKDSDIPQKATLRFRKQIYALFALEKTAPLLHAFYEANILQKLIPMMGRIMNLAQFDGYHQLPVDLHSIEVVDQYENIKDEHVKNIYDTFTLKQQQFLKMIAFVHDVGKGRQRDHHDIGANQFKLLGKSLEMSDAQISLGSRLIQYHTHLSLTAMREDIYSQKVAHNFMNKMQTKDALDMLFVLTYADINGVGNGKYSSFNADLIREFYHRCGYIVGQTEQLSEAKTRARREKLLVQNSDFLALPRLLQKKVLRIESNLFFLKFKSSQIVTIASLAKQAKTYEYRIDNDKRFIISILSKKPFHLGWFLSQFTHLDLVSMDIFKLFDDAKLFRMQFDGTLEKEMLEHLSAMIEAAFDMDRKVSFKKPILHKKEISFDCDHSLTYALMQIKTKNQKGLMAMVIEIFDQFKIDIATAKINTVKNTARDTFLIEKSEPFCDNREKIVDLLVKHD
jgi:[protein-PII] uridylyltransferase